MAKKDDIGLLSEIVSQLRKLNASSVRDRLREAEEAKRAEGLIVAEEATQETQGQVLDGATDFQRRFLAGQLRTEFNSKVKETPAKLWAQKTSHQFLASIHDELMVVNKERVLDGEAPLEGGALGAITDYLKKINDDGRNARRHLLESKKMLNSMDISLMLLSNEIGPNSIAVHDASTQKSIGEVLASDEKRANELDQQRNSDMRSREEARREAIKNGGAAGGIGGFGAGGSGTGEDGEEGGGFFKSLMQGGLLQKLPAGLLGLFGIRKALNSKWFKRQVKARWKLAGKKMFPKAKKKVRGNPRLWPLLLAGYVISSFSSAAEETMSDIDGEDPGAEGDDGLSLESGGDILTVDNALNTYFAYSITKDVLKSRIVKSTASKLATAFASAPKNSIMGRMAAASGSSKTGWLNKIKGASKTGLLRGGLRFLGPWGLAAWGVWTIVDWKMKQNAQALADLNETEAEISAAEANNNFDDVIPEFRDYGVLDKNSKAKGAKAAQMERVKELFATVAKDKREALKASLVNVGGWDEAMIDGIMMQQDAIDKKELNADLYGKKANADREKYMRDQFAKKYNIRIPTQKELDAIGSKAGLRFKDNIAKKQRELRAESINTPAIAGGTGGTHVGSIHHDSSTHSVVTNMLFIEGQAPGDVTYESPFNETY